MDAFTAGVLRSMLAGIAALLICLVFRLRFPQEARHWWLLIVSGLCSFAIWPALMSVGIKLTTASHAGLIMAILPIMTVLLASISSRMMPRPAWWVGASLAFLGAAFLVVERVGIIGAIDAPSPLTGDLVIFAGCLACATGYVAGGRLSPVIGSMATTFCGLALALTVLIPLFWLNLDATDWRQVPVTAWAAIAWMALLSSLLGYALWFYALGKGGIARIGSLQLMMPLVAIIAAVLVLREPLTVELAGVCAMILAGTLIAQKHAPHG
jgi:drug/metabolite transporter (DMT)-like permease